MSLALSLIPAQDVRSTIGQLWLVWPLVLARAEWYVLIPLQDVITLLLSCVFVLVLFLLLLESPGLIPLENVVYRRVVLPGDLHALSGNALVPAQNARLRSLEAWRAWRTWHILVREGKTRGTAWRSIHASSRCGCDAVAAIHAAPLGVRAVSHGHTQRVTLATGRDRKSVV